MKIYYNLKHIVACILVISILFGPLSVMITEASDGYQNLTGSYNCYAYAINRVDELDNDVRFYNNTQTEKLYQPGDISKDIYNSFSFDPTISYETMLLRIKCNVISDLYAIGHTDVSLHYFDNSVDYEEGYDYYDFYNDLMDTTNSSTHELICFRVGPADYHFMKYDSATESWYNKNGYNPIFKYTDNNGIPANDVAWIGTNTYDSDIIYVKYNKLQLEVNQSGFVNGTITVKGGADDSNTPLYCCGITCCNPNGVCTCESEVINKGKDAVYEIIIPESDCYNISMQIGGSLGFYCDIYSYNMYNGNYKILSNATDSQDFDTNVFLEVGENISNNYYIRVHFNKLNQYDITVPITVTRGHTYAYESYSATQHLAYCECGESELQNHIIENGVCTACGAEHTHDYTDHYENNTLLQHKAYCWCGEYKLQKHQFVDGVCTLCELTHEHLFTYHWLTNTTHQEVCMCGEEGRIKPHIVDMGSFAGGATNATCIVCGGIASIGISQVISTGELPRTENGSFILPNGIIVLADEDMEAYFDGTLEFIYTSDNLETE